MQRFISLLLGIVGLSSSLAHAQMDASKGSVDAMVNWGNPWDLTPAKFTKIAEALPKKKSEPACNTRVGGGGKVYYTIARPPTGGGKVSLFNGEVRVDRVVAQFDADKPLVIGFSIGSSDGGNVRKADLKEVDKLKAGLARVTGDGAPKPYEHIVSEGHPPVIGQQWTHRNYKVQMFELHSHPVSGPGKALGIFFMQIVPLDAK